MVSLLKNLSCLYILLEMLSGYEHILDKSTVREGGRFSVSCSLRRAFYSQPIAGQLIVATIMREPLNKSNHLIVTCGLRTKLHWHNLSRPWIFKGVDHCQDNNPDFLISVEVTDAKCSDAGLYKCLALYRAGGDPLTGYAMEELRRDDSCDNKEVSPPSDTSARLESTPMQWPIVVGVIVISHLLDGSLLLGLS